MAGWLQLSQGDRDFFRFINCEIRIEPHFHLAFRIYANHAILYDHQAMNFEEIFEPPECSLK